MSRRLPVLMFSALLTTIGLVGLAPTAAADDCGDACIEECHVGVGTSRVAAQCEIGHQSTGADLCAKGGDCSEWVIQCSALVSGEAPGCTVSPVDTEVCQPISADYGVCADPYGEDCKMWVYMHFGGERCIIPAAST